MMVFELRATRKVALQTSLHLERATRDRMHEDTSSFGRSLAVTNAALMALLSLSGLLIGRFLMTTEKALSASGGAKE